MIKLLHIKASPRDGLSHSGKAADGFVAALQGKVPDLRVAELDVWSAELPHLDGPLLAAKYARLAGRALTDDEAAAWTRIEELVHNLDTADAILISSPMWNLSIPYRLKHYIDLVTQPGLSFSFHPTTGYTPLLRARPVVAILASAGDFSQGPSWGRPDLATPYLKEALKFIGLVGAEIVPVGPIAGNPQGVGAAAERAGEALRDIADRFARAAA